MAGWQSPAYCNGLENRRRLIAVQGFESLPRRHLIIGDSFNGRTPVSKTVIPFEGVVWVRIPGPQPLQIFKEVFVWKKEIPLLTIEMFPEEKH